MSPKGMVFTLSLTSLSMAPYPQRRELPLALRTPSAVAKPSSAAAMPAREACSSFKDQASQAGEEKIRQSPENTRETQKEKNRGEGPSRAGQQTKEGARLRTERWGSVRLDSGSEKGEKKRPKTKKGVPVNAYPRFHPRFTIVDRKKTVTISTVWPQVVLEIEFESTRKDKTGEDTRKENKY